MLKPKVIRKPAIATEQWVLSPSIEQAQLPLERQPAGSNFMLPGRVGDTPILGCGVYADNDTGAVSMTGWGESIMRLAMAKADL
jgi:hypothetical protein